MSASARAVDSVLRSCLGVRPGEDVLVVTDPPRSAIGAALVAAARELGAEAVLADMAERDNSGVEPPGAIAAAMLACDVLIAPTTKSLSHTEARRAATARGVRGATMPGITSDMLERTMSADYGAVKERSIAIAERLTAGSEVRVTNDAGTDVTFRVDGRAGMADTGDLTQPGSFGNLPAGEGFVGPLEGLTRGRVVFDGVVGSDPIEVQIDDGYATSFSAAGEAFRARVSGYGPDALAVAELGIGTNEAATLTGNVLEDEKILGTIHIAFGDNSSFGGRIRVPSHHDFVVLAPTVAIDGVALLERGRLLM